MLLPALIPPGRCATATEHPPGGLLIAVDLRCCPTARAARSVLVHRITQLQCELFTHPQVDRAAIVVTLGGRVDARRIRARAATLAAAVLHRIELRRGRPCGILVVIDEGDDGPESGLADRVRGTLDQIPQGWDVVDASDVLALGLRLAVFNGRV